jgi:hypothetical protein
MTMLRWQFKAFIKANIQQIGGFFVILKKCKVVGQLEKNTNGAI